jgi:hypothetical protein
MSKKLEQVSNIVDLLAMASADGAGNWKWSAPGPS